MRIPEDMIKGRLHKTLTHGLLEVVEYYNSKSISFKFLNTGYMSTCRADQMRSGKVRDYLSPSVCGVGFIGDGIFKASSNGKTTKAYSTWKSIIERCYSKSRSDTHPTYADCYICDDWHNFQVFAEWFYLNYKDGCQIDKDIKINGNKIYSPDACLFVTAKENMVQAHAKHYMFTSPSGEVVNIYNLNEFCRNNNLLHGPMSSVSLGNRGQHRGWTQA